MKPSLTLAANVLAAAMMSEAYAADSPAAGLYTNLRYIAEADDFVGMNLEILAGPSPAVSYERCEGWCNGAQEFPAKIRDDTIRFTVREEVGDRDGDPVPPRIYRVEAKLVRTLTGPKLVVTSPDDRELHEVLRPAVRRAAKRP